MATTFDLCFAAERRRLHSYSALTFVSYFLPYLEIRSILLLKSHLHMLCFINLSTYFWMAFPAICAHFLSFFFQILLDWPWWLVSSINCDWVFLQIYLQVYVLKRPYVDEFLQKMGELFECVLFTASLAKVWIKAFSILFLKPLRLVPEISA